MLSENRSQRNRELQERTRRYLKRVNKIIRKQQAVQEQTRRGAKAERQADKQKTLTDETERLRKEIEQDEAAEKQAAEEIRKRIFEETKLTASAGVSFNKFIAKVASDINKPNGIKVITPNEAIPFLENLKIEKFHEILF